MTCNILFNTAAVAAAAVFGYERIYGLSRKSSKITVY